MRERILEDKGKFKKQVRSKAWFVLMKRDRGNNNRGIDRKLNKSFYVGKAVLKISKLVKYDVSYNTFKRHLGERCELLSPDTDSLVVKIWTEDFYEGTKNILNSSTRATK